MKENEGKINDEKIASQPQSFLKMIIRRILINGRVKHEIDTGVPVNQLFVDT